MRYQCPGCGRELGYEGLCWHCRAQQERSAVLNWTEEEIEEKLRHLIAHADRLDDWDTEEYRDACRLQEVRGICPPELQRAAVRAGVTWLDQLYYHAPDDVRDELIRQLLTTEEVKDASNLMQCVAMQGDDVSLAALLKLEQNPRPWRKKLYVDPSVYAQKGGWTFDREGNRRPLVFDTCYSMVKGDRQADQAVTIARPREDVCPHCGCKMVDMLVLDGRDERLRFLGLDGILTATCCPNCVCYTDFSFSRFTLDGGSTPLSSQPVPEGVENYVGEAGLQGMASNSFVLGSQPVPPFYGANSEDLITIGGFANWIQDWEYATCPDCGRPMRYLAQIPWDLLEDGLAEGTLYIEVCPDCQVAAMHHQQT